MHISAESVRFVDLTINSTGEQPCIIEIFSSGSLDIVNCLVVGEYSAIEVYDQQAEAGNIISGSGEGGKLSAKRSSIRGRRGNGVWVWGRAVLEEQSSISGNGGYGVAVYGSLAASHTSVDGNGMSNVLVAKCSQAELRHVSSDGSKDGSGWRVHSQGYGNKFSILTATHSSASNNSRSGTHVGHWGLATSGLATLDRCECDDNGQVGFKVEGESALVVCNSQAKGNGEGNAAEVGNGELQ